MRERRRVPSEAGSATLGALEAREHAGGDFRAAALANPDFAAPLLAAIEQTQPRAPCDPRARWKGGEQG